MDLSLLYHEPSWLKVHVSAAIASCGILALLFMWFLAARSRKRDIYKPSQLLAEAFGTHVENETGPKKDPTTRSASTLSKPKRTAGSLLRLISCTIAICGGLFAARNYILLSNWADGDQRDFLGDHIGAIVCYKKALRVDPTLRRTHFLIATSLLELGRPTAAIPELAAAADGEHVNGDPAALLGDTLQVLKRYPEALKYYKAAIVIDPKNARYQIGLAHTSEVLGDFSAAYRAYTQAIISDNQNCDARMQLGRLLVDRGDMDEGIANCRKAAELAPKSELAHYTLATAFGRAGYYTGASTEYLKVLDLNPRSILAHFNLGATMERMNEPSRAADQFKYCVKLIPLDEPERSAVKHAAIELHRLTSKAK